jgi:putative Mg2+ transporter-C (MgtC) family protein
MPVALTWTDIGLRLALTVLAGALLGWDRSAKGHSAGLKTTLMVGLAACLAMIQTNWLLDTAGKPPGSFVTLDLMRLPLGVLTGVGFIGGGAILKDKGEVLGLTTAATLWIVTILGLCFGGGQNALGVAGAALAFAILRGLHPLEKRMSEKRAATFSAQWREGAFGLTELKAAIAAAKLELVRCSVAQNAQTGTAEATCGVSYKGEPGRYGPPAELVALLQRAGALQWEWSE